MDKIKIENLEIYAFHGVYPEENKQGQPFFVNAVLFTDIREAGEKDDLNLSTNYGEVCHYITNWMREHTFQLIEAVAEQLAKAVLLQFPLIKEIKLEIRKPYAPVGLPFESVSVCVKRGWHKVYLAIGSNMGQKTEYIKKGIEALDSYSEIKVKKVSERIVTKPYGGVEQDDFVNGALEIETLFSPKQLLSVLHKIEAEAGRERLIHWGPRTLDLDIIFYDKLVYEDEELIIPHIDMQNRYFVLKPLSELIPNFRHPVLGQTISQMLENCKQGK